MKKKSIVIIIIIIIFIIIASYLVLQPDIRIMTVSGTSMNPTITQNDIVIVTSVDTKFLKIGDIITYRHSIEERELMFTHRIIDIRNGIINTRGDSLPNPDGYNVTTKDVIGKVVWTIPYAGYIMRLAHTFAGYFIFILIPSFLLIAIELKNMLKNYRNRGKVNK